VEVIPPHVLSDGLYRLAGAYGRKLDAGELRMWAEVLQPINEAQFKHGLLQVMRTWTSSWMPPPAMVLAAAYEAPADLVCGPPPKALLREGEFFWSSPAQANHLLAIVRENPRKPTEPWLAYVHRLAALGGLLSEQREQSAQMGFRHVTAEAREPGQEG
jgi:hypothetical protein